jgi:hypothetical protein
MKNVNTKCKTEIRIFKDWHHWLSRVGEHCNPEYIGVEEMYMHLHMQKVTYYVQICDKYNYIFNLRMKITLLRFILIEINL